MSFGVRPLCFAVFTYLVVVSGRLAMGKLYFWYPVILLLLLAFIWGFWVIFVDAL